MAYVLDTFNAGIALLKEDANGNFVKLGTTATDNNGTITYSQKNVIKPIFYEISIYIYINGNFFNVFVKLWANYVKP